MSSQGASRLGRWQVRGKAIALPPLQAVKLQLQSWINRAAAQACKHLSGAWDTPWCWSTGMHCLGNFQNKQADGHHMTQSITDSVSLALE